MSWRSDDAFTHGFVIGILIGFIVGGALAVGSYSMQLRQQDKLIEALRKELGAPDPDGK